jgi:hypothetical protein
VELDERWLIHIQPTRPDLPILSFSTFRLPPSARLEQVLNEARCRIDAVLTLGEIRHERTTPGISTGMAMPEHVAWPYVTPNILAEVFDEAWPMVRPKQLVDNSCADMSVWRSRVILEIAARGVTDANELRRLAIKDFLLGKGSG